MVFVWFGKSKQALRLWQVVYTFMNINRRACGQGICCIKCFLLKEKYEQNISDGVNVKEVSSVFLSFYVFSK